MSNTELFYTGLALYWGEGTKVKRGVVEFTNSDSKMIVFMMTFFRNVCAVPESKFRGHLYIHEHLSIQDAESHWSKLTGIPREQFQKTTIQQNKKKTHKDSLPYGTFAVVICDTELKLKILGWIEGLYNAVQCKRSTV